MNSQSKSSSINKVTKKNRAQIRRESELLARINFMNSAVTLLATLEEHQQLKPREIFTAEIKGLLDSVLTRALKLDKENLNISAIQSLARHHVKKDANQIENSANKSGHQKAQNTQSATPPRHSGISGTGHFPASQSSVKTEKPSIHHEKEGYITPQSAKELLDYHPEVILYAPQIPPNTGTIARACAALSARLHLIEPLGFDLSEKAVRRAGLDYWPFVDITVHKDWDSFVATRPDRRYLVVETGGSQSPHLFKFEPGDLLIFGAETFGFPNKLMDELKLNHRFEHLTIPMFNRGVRSLNLSNTVSIVLHSAIASLQA